MHSAQNIAAPELQQKGADLLIKVLSRLESSGNRPHQIFEDWIQIVESILEGLPRNIRSLHQGGGLAEDPPDVADLWARLRSRYPQERHWEQFSEAFSILLKYSEKGYMDVLGTAYMLFANPKGFCGQFFTPLQIALLMGQMTILDGAGDVNKRLMEACDRLMVNGTEAEKARLEAMCLAGLIVSEDRKIQFITENILPIIRPYYRPICVLDPCCGSGVMLISAAAQFPSWAVQLGLVQFYGMDIDINSVRMARINAMLYGLNGAHLKWFVELNSDEIKALPDPFSSVYLAAQEAYANGDMTRVEELSLSMRSQAYSFLNLGTAAQIAEESRAPAD